MKSSTYKKTADGIVKIDSNINKLELNKSDMFLKAYQQAILDVSNKRYTFTMENLQDAITAILGRLNDIEISEYKEIYHYLISACSKREKYSIRQSISFDLMKDIQCEYFIENSGINQTYILEVINEIKKVLLISEYKVFNLYHVKGYTQKQIAVKLDSNQTDISRILETVLRKIENLKISYLYENRYIAYQSKKKKRQHKRKVLTQKEVIELCGEISKVKISDYKPSEKLQSNNIPSNKGLSYPTKQYYKTKREDFAYTGKIELQDEYYFTSNLTLGKSKIKPFVIDGKKTIEYLENNKL